MVWEWVGVAGGSRAVQEGCSSLTPTPAGAPGVEGTCVDAATIKGREHTPAIDKRRGGDVASDADAQLPIKVVSCAASAGGGGWRWAKPDRAVQNKLNCWFQFEGNKQQRGTGGGTGRAHRASTVLPQHHARPSTASPHVEYSFATRAVYVCPLAAATGCETSGEVEPVPKTP